MTSFADVRALGTTVGIWAHPDDETYLAGGLMAALRDAGQRVVCVTATRGDAGNGLHIDGTEAQRAALGAVRTAELARALDLLGGVEHHWLDYADGRLVDVNPETAIRRLLMIMDDVRPQTVISFGPDGVTGHRDHRTVAAWTFRAASRARPRPSLLQAAFTPDDLQATADLDERFGIFEAGPPPPVAEHELAVRLRLTGSSLDRKVAALVEQRSQTGELIETIGRERFAAWVNTESFRLARTELGTIADPRHTQPVDRFGP